jgi:TolB protein
VRRVVLLVLGVVLLIMVGIGGGAYWLLQQVPSSPVLLVQQRSGNLVLVDAEGGQRALTTDADRATRVYDFPVVAPDGRSVAYVETLVEDDGFQFSLIMHELRGERHTLFTSDEVSPFYLYWSPDSRYLAFLGGVTGGMVLNNVNTRGTPDVKLVTPGQPSYFSWRPDSQQLLLHTRGAAPRGTIGLWNLGDAEPQILPAPPALFNAPMWLDGGDASLVALQDGATVTLTRLDKEGKVERSLATGGNGMFFEAAPNGSAVAFVQLRGPNLGPLQLVDMDGTNARTVSTDAAFAFVWSPDSKRIAYLTIPSEAETRPAAMRKQADIRLTWNVVDVATGTSRALHTFEPSREFLNLLPYFDQYTKSMHIWDEKSQRLVFADTEGVWTVDAESGETSKVADGVLGMWIGR